MIPMCLKDLVSAEESNLQPTDLRGVLVLCYPALGPRSETL